MRCRFYILLAALICVSFISCQWDRGGKSGQSLDIKIHRYDKLLDEYVSLNSFSALQKINTEYQEETKFLIEDVLSIGAVNEEGISQRLREFYSDTILQELTRDALLKYNDMSRLEREFTQGFRRLRKELPNILVPSVYSQISALNQSVVVGDSILGFSIDKYMGTDYPLYKNYYYDYQSRSMSPERIIPDCFKFYLLSEYPFPWEWHRTLLDHIMHMGKIHWVIAKVLNYKSFEEELGYTQEEGSWCSERSDSIWNYLVISGQLHATDPMLVRVYMNPAQYTYPLGVESPSEVGVWLGMQMVDAYMKKNKSVTIAELLADTNYKGMLQSANISY